MKQETVDVLVIGGGGAGLSAAISAARKGANVLLTEKSEGIGGATGLSVGTISASGTIYQKRAGIKDSVSSHFSDYLKFIPQGKSESDYDLNLTHLLIEIAPKVLNRMVNLGLDYTGPHPEPPHSVPRMHNVIGGSKQYINKLKSTARSLGVKIETSTTADHLILDKKGIVDGAVLKSEIDNNPLAIKSNLGVILATGYYTPNQLTTTNDGLNSKKLSIKVTGKGIDLARSIGAAIVEDPAGESPSLRTPSQPYVRPEPALFKNGAVLINLEGRRFTNELDKPEFDLDQQFQNTGYILFDSTLASKIASEKEDSANVRDGWLKNQKLFLSTFPEIAYAYIDDYLEKTSYFFVANSIENLCNKTSLPTNNVEQEIATINRISQYKLKDPFGRKPLVPSLVTPPYYAIGPVKTESWLRFGIKIDSKTRVLTESGRPIQKLFAAGISGSSNTLVAGHGHALVWAFGTGHIAGKQIMEEHDR